MTESVPHKNIISNTNPILIDMKTTASVPFYSLFISLFVLFVTGFMLTEPGQESGEWEVPDRFKQLENPVEADNSSQRIGQSLFRRNCRACHGSEGAGDGPESHDLNTPMRDFGSEEVQEQTDGELFYKTGMGRDEMPGFRADLYEEDIWHIVNYIRTLRNDSQ